MCNLTGNCTGHPLGQIDRDIKRVEDKADANTAAIASNYSEQGQRIAQNSERIARSQERIACLGKRLEEVKSCTAGLYCKGEIDCRLDAKAGRCEFEKHLADSHAHEELLGRKVDKANGFGLISDECLAQICRNQEALLLLERYIRELQERSQLLETELAGKASIATPQMHNIQAAAGIVISPGSVFFKDAFNQVTIHGVAETQSQEPFTYDQLITTLPKGFRPRVYIGAPASTNQQGMSSIVIIRGDGTICASNQGGDTFGNRIWFSASFLAEDA